MDKTRVEFEPAEKEQKQSADWRKSWRGIEMHSAWMGYANYRFLNYE